MLSTKTFPTSHFLIPYSYIVIPYSLQKQNRMHLEPSNYTNTETNNFISQQDSVYNISIECYSTLPYSDMQPVLSNNTFAEGNIFLSAKMLSTKTFATSYFLILISLLLILISLFLILGIY